MANLNAGDKQPWLYVAHAGFAAQAMIRDWVLGIREIDNRQAV